MDVSAESVAYANCIAISVRRHEVNFTEDSGKALFPAGGTESGRSLRVITAQFILGTKMEAFGGRCHMDFQASHDLEVCVAVLEGRDTLLYEAA